MTEGFTMRLSSLQNLMRGGVVLGAFALAACSSPDDNAPQRHPAGSTGGTDGTSTPGSVVDPNSTAGVCAGVALPVTALQDSTASEIRLVAGDIYAKIGNAVVRVKKDGSGREDVYTSENLVHVFVDDQSIVTIEQGGDPDNPTAVVNVFPRPGSADPTTGAIAPPLTPDSTSGAIAGMVSTNTDWNAAGSTVVGSDPGNFYALADAANVGDTVFQIQRGSPGTMAQIAQLNAPLADVQLVGGDVWFTRDGKRVYRASPGALDPADPANNTDATATEMFGSAADCKLAVGGGHVFCSTGPTVEERDLTGGSPTTFFDAKSAALLGDARFVSDALIVRTAPTSATDPAKNGIRAIKGASDAKVLACGRAAITESVADATSVVWVESGVGVFVAPR